MAGMYYIETFWQDVALLGAIRNHYLDLLVSDNQLVILACCTAGGK